MARLSLYLPPFAGDYSGACSTLFGLDCLVVLVDAGCCTRNYVEYDEPRWARRRKTAFSAQLRTLEATLGDDERIVGQTVEAARELGCSCIALVGTPVPAITGMDMAGVACEVERRAGVPAIGISTCGFETYEHGVARALEALLKRFALPRAAAVRAGGCAASGSVRVNVFGLSPHDFAGEADAEALLEWLRAAGFELAFAPSARYSLDDVAAAATADFTLAVASSGLSAARLLERELGIPYVAARPLDAADARDLAARCGRLEACLDPDDLAAVLAPNPTAPPLLLVGEQLAMNALRRQLRARTPRLAAARPLVVASFFSLDPVHAEAADLHLPCERTLVEFARAHPGFDWMGDPLLQRIPGFSDRPGCLLPHEAVSSSLFSSLAAEQVGEGLVRTAAAFAKSLDC